MLTVLWYAQRKGIPVEDIEVAVERENAPEYSNVYRLNTRLTRGGALSDVQRGELLSVAGKCPIHKLMTRTTTEVTTMQVP